MIVVVADDFSGAAELAGAAWRHGLKAALATGAAPEPAGEVTVLDTDSRGLAPEAAAARLEALAKRVAGWKPRWVYKKTDSVLRGPVAAECLALAGGLGLRRVVLAPANPRRGRIVSGGRLLVDGAPVNETVFAEDPDCPARAAEVGALLARGGREGDAAHVARGSRHWPETGLVAPDAELGSDLAVLARRLTPGDLPAGALEFFEAVLAARVRARPGAVEDVFPGTPGAAALLVCGSAASWAAREARFQAAGLPVCLLPEDAALDAAWAERVAGEWRTRGGLLMGLGAPRREGAPPALAARLAAAAAAVVREAEANASVFAEGGATAAALARAAGWERFEVLGEPAPGTCALKPVAAGAPRFVVKPGSYDWPPAMEMAMLEGR